MLEKIFNYNSMTRVVSQIKISSREWSSFYATNRYFVRLQWIECIEIKQGDYYYYATHVSWPNDRWSVRRSKPPFLFYSPLLFWIFRLRFSRVVCSTLYHQRKWESKWEAIKLPVLLSNCSPTVQIATWPINWGKRKMVLLCSHKKKPIRTWFPAPLSSLQQLSFNTHWFDEKFPEHIHFVEWRVSTRFAKSLCKE